MIIDKRYLSGDEQRRLEIYWAGLHKYQNSSVRQNYACIPLSVSNQIEKTADNINLPTKSAQPQHSEQVLMQKTCFRGAKHI